MHFSACLVFAVRCCCPLGCFSPLWHHSYVLANALTRHSTTATADTMLLISLSLSKRTDELDSQLLCRAPRTSCLAEVRIHTFAISWITLGTCKRILLHFLLTPLCLLCKNLGHKWLYVTSMIATQYIACYIATHVLVYTCTCKHRLTRDAKLISSCWRREAHLY